MKLAVIGSRTFDDFKLLKSELDKLDIDLIISGRSSGADSLAERYALDKNIPTQIFCPDWNQYGEKAGFLRNIEIVNACDKLIAFWDGKSKGSESSIHLAEKQNKLLKIVMFGD